MCSDYLFIKIFKTALNKQTHTHTPNVCLKFRNFNAFSCIKIESELNIKRIHFENIGLPQLRNIK